MIKKLNSALTIVRRKNICPEDVWQSVADIQNIQISNATYVQYARELVAREKRQDFQKKILRYRKKRKQMKHYKKFIYQPTEYKRCRPFYH